MLFVLSDATLIAVKKFAQKSEEALQSKEDHRAQLILFTAQSKTKSYVSYTRILTRQF